MPKDIVVPGIGDQEPGITPLKPESTQFLKTYEDYLRNSWAGNLLLGSADNYSAHGKKLSIWSHDFMGRLFSMQTVEEAQELLEPWVEWSETRNQIFSDYWNGDHDDSTRAYNLKLAQFEAVEIPEQIKQYQGRLTDKELKSFVSSDYFRITREIFDSLAFLEGKEPRPSAGTVFRLQWMANMTVPIEQLSEEDTTKPPVKKFLAQDGTEYLAFFEEDEPSEGTAGYADTASAEQWDRWNQIEVGNYAEYLTRDHMTRKVKKGSGRIVGFSLLGAGDAMLFGPSLGLVGILAVNDQSGKLECPLFEDVRLEGERFSTEKVKPKKAEPIEVNVIDPKSGEITSQTFTTMEEASAEIIDKLKNI